MKKNTFSMLLGLAIIAIGVAYAGNVIGFWELDFSLAGWWTLFIIVPCASSMFSGGVNVFNCTGLSVGILLLLNAQGVFRDNLGSRLVLPVIIVAIGLSVVLNKSGMTAKRGTNGVFAGNKGESFFAIFGGNTPQFTGEVFRGASAYTVFGEINLRLQDSFINRDCAISVYTVFGSTKIVLPGNVRVIISSTPIFGEVSNDFHTTAPESAPTVYIRAVSVFGETSIK